MLMQLIVSPQARSLLPARLFRLPKARITELAVRSFGSSTWAAAPVLLRCGHPVGHARVARPFAWPEALDNGRQRDRGCLTGGATRTRPVAPPFARRIPAFIRAVAASSRDFVCI